MAGVNSLGIGSNVLTADLLDKLRAADDKTILKPLETKLELSNQKEEAYTLLSSLMTTFKSSTSSLGNESLYLARSVDGSNEDVTVSAKAGADVQSFNITNVNKAEKDVWNSTNSFTNISTPISNLGSGTLTVEIDGETLDIEYTATTSLEDIKTAINDGIGEKMTASNLQIGDSEYSFAISADALNQAITFSDSNASAKQLNTVTLTADVAAGNTFTWSDGVNSITLDEALGELVDGETPTQSGVRIADAINTDPTLSALYTAVAVDGGFTIESKTDGLSFTGTSSGTLTSDELTTTASNDGSGSLLTQLGLNNIQAAKPATFDYNGISITRSSNDISDLINGVTITLNQNQDANASANIKINQNSTSISTEMSLMVENFNLLSSNLSDMTNYDAETSNQGVFFGDNFVKSISRSLTNILTTVNSSGNSLIDYGLEIDKDGVMSLNSSLLNEKFAEDPVALQELFQGTSGTITLYKQMDTITLTGDAVAGDTYTWSDGTNSIVIDLVDGETPELTGQRIADAINADDTLKNLYTATETLTGFTIESNSRGLAFTGISTSSGSQSSLEATTTPASKTADDAVLGVFKELDNKMQNFTGSNQLLSNFSTQLSDARENLIAQYDKQKATLDTRYEIMTKKFAAYDSIISKLNNSFASLQMMIDAEANNNS